MQKAIPAFSILALLLSAHPAPAQRQTAPAWELGRIMIFEYHLIEPQESRWGRSVANFRGDIRRLYDAGYRPVGLGDFIDGHIDLPAGTRPFILTFDDSSEGQFRFLLRNGKPELDPDCAVGILSAFHRQHPDFALRGIFFVLPGAKEPHKLFGQPEFEALKLRQLVEFGFEIGNHTVWHADLAKYDAAVVQEQIGRAAEMIRAMVPGYRMRAIALPFGNFPKNPALVAQGTYKGISYHYDAALLVGGGAAPSPFSIRCNLTHLPRIQAGPELERALSYYQKHPEESFVSDGDPNSVTIPDSLQADFNSGRFKKLRVAIKNGYNDHLIPGRCER